MSSTRLIYIGLQIAGLGVLVSFGSRDLSKGAAPGPIAAAIGAFLLLVVVCEFCRRRQMFPLPVVLALALVAFAASIDLILAGTAGLSDHLAKEGFAANMAPLFALMGARLDALDRAKQRA